MAQLLSAVRGLVKDLCTGFAATQSRPAKKARLSVERLEEYIAPAPVLPHPAHLTAPTAVVHHAPEHTPTAHRPQASSSVYYLSVGSVLSFNTSNPSWYYQDLAHVQGIQIGLNTANHAFAIYVPNTFYGTMSGHFNVQNGAITFSATRAVSTGYSGYTYSHIDLAIVPKNGHLYMGFVSRSGSTLAAVVNGTGFGSSSLHTYSAVVELR
jgi:hypothetical protein